MKKCLLIVLLFISFTGISQQSYKDLMHDPSVNFYDVCAAADAYFQTIDKDAKGSGWKPYQRWKYANESKYYPSGDRSIIDPYLANKSYDRIVAESGSVASKTLYEEGWTEVGPVSIDSVTTHYSPGLGRLETFYVDPSDANRMYFGSRSGGIWSTTDGGENWHGGSTDFLPAAGVNTLTVSPTNSDSVLINVSSSHSNASHGIYRSEDGGYTWTETNFNPVLLGMGGLGDNFVVNKIFYHPLTPDLIFIATREGLYRSDDNLETYSTVTTDENITRVEFHPADPNIIYVYERSTINANRILRSTDGGLTFSLSEEILENEGNLQVYLDVSPLCSDCVYFGSESGVWLSMDSGMTFDFHSTAENGSIGLAISDLDTSKMTLGNYDIYYSDNGGATFEQSTWWALLDGIELDGTSYIHSDLRDTECVNGVFYTVTDGYFAKSENGIDWERLVESAGIRENYTLGVSQSNHYQTIVGSQDNGTSVKLESGWIETGGGDGMEGIIQPLNPDWMIGSAQFGWRRRTFDQGQSQELCFPTDYSGSWVAPLAYDPNDQQTVYDFGQNVHKSLDFASNWSVVGSPSFDGIITGAAIAENNSNILVTSSYENIELSTDGGATYTDIRGILPNRFINDISFDPNQDSTLIVVYGFWTPDAEKVFISHDLGSTWENISFNLFDMPIHTVLIDHLNPSTIYLGTEIGVYTMDMGGSEWELYNDDLPNCTVREIEMVNGTNTIRAATWGRGVWEYTLKDRATYPAILTTEITNPPTFTQPETGADQWVTSTIHYDGELSDVFIKWSIDEPTFDSLISMENISDTTWKTIDPIVGLDCGTKVYFKVFAVGEDSDTTETYKFMYTAKYVPIESPYCESYGNTTWNTSVTLVNFSDLSSPTDKPSGYSDYSNICGNGASVLTGESYDLTVNINTDGAYNAHAKAWIDWNQDEDFADPGEGYALGMAFDTEDGITSLSPLEITVPEGATLGETKMRVVCRFSSEPTLCETDFDGEVEDYKITVQPNIILDYEIVETDICQGEKIHFEYTGSIIDGILWTYSNGIDTYTSTNMADSILLVSPGEYDLTLIVSLDEYSDGGTWSNIVHVHPTYHDSTEMAVCPNESYVFGSQVLTESGEYLEVFESEYGCDSTITLFFEVNNVDVSTSLTGFELSANEDEATYQWLDCNDSWTEIIDEVSQNFIPIANGSYAVQITDNITGCVDTSDCFDIFDLNVSDNLTDVLQIFPNPSNGDFTIDLKTIIPELDLKIFDAGGKLIYAQEYSKTNRIDLNLGLAKGSYYVEITVDENTIKEVVVIL